MRPLIIFDGDCSFCRRWIARWQHFACGKIDFEPYQSGAPRFPKIPTDNFKRAIHLIEPDGSTPVARPIEFTAPTTCFSDS